MYHISCFCLCNSRRFSIVQSRLDYCNSLIVGMSEADFSKLQRVQNTLARVVFRRGKFDHITPTLSELHWLPI